MSALTEEQQKKLNKLEGEIASIDEKIAEVEKARAPLEYRRNKAKLEKELKDLKKKKKEVEAKIKERQDKVETFVKLLGGSGAPREVYKIFIPGGSELRVNYYHLNNLGKQMNAYFSRLDNPFLDTYTVPQREELLKSILGSTATIPTTPATVITANNAVDSD